MIVGAGRDWRLALWPAIHPAPLGLLAVLLVTTFAVIPLIPRTINPYDEGMVAYGAERVLHGQRPAVDFYSPYGPGVFYLIAFAYRLFGTRLLVERWVAAMMIVAVGCLGYALLMGRRSDGVRHPSAIISAVTGAVAALMLASGWWYTPVNGGALSLMLLSGLALQRGLNTGSPAWAVVAGAVTGLTLIWRLAFGGALLIANVVTWAVTVGGATDEQRQQNRLTGLLTMAAAAVAVALPVYAGLIAAGGERAFHSLLVWPLTSTGAANLPWPPLVVQPDRGVPLLDQLAAMTHAAGFYYGVAALLLLLWRLPFRALPAADRQLGLWLLLLLPPLFLYANGRTDYLHVTPLLTMALMLSGLAVDSGLSVEASSLRQRFWQALGLVVWAVSIALLTPTILYSVRSVWQSPGRRPMELPGPRGAGIYPPYRYSRQYSVLLPLIHTNVAPAQSIYSGTTRHDIFLVNDILLYFLAERNAATYYWCLDAGVTSSAPVQQQMLAEMSRGGVAAAVLWTAPRAEEENKGGRSSSVRALDNWLSREFVPVRVPRVMYDVRLRAGLWRP